MRNVNIRYNAGYIKANMALISETGQKIPLGVGKILGDSFSILFSNFLKLFIIGSVLTFSAMALIVVTLSFAAFTAIVLLSGYGPVVFLLAMTPILMAAYGLITGLVVQLAYDAKLGRHSPFSIYIQSALPALLPIVVMSAVVAVLSYVGALAFLIGALWVYAVFFVMVPVAVIEHAGFGAMRRSAFLTKEYRWPIVGAFVFVMIINGLLFRAAEFLAELTSLALPPGIEALIAYGMATASIIGLGLVYGGIVTALIYARLREIKEDVDVDQLAAVFD